MSSAKTARWLDLLAYLLQHRFAVTREQIFARVQGYAGGGETARRKFERDKDELKRLGVEIETVPLPNQPGNEAAVGYRLAAAGMYLPYFELADSAATERPYRGLARMTLTAEELVILDRATRRLAQQAAHPLAEPARTSRRKLEFDLPLEADVVERVLGLPVPEAGRRALAVLQTAVIARIPVRCRYYSVTRDRDEALTLEPFGLLFQWSHWYCVARVVDGDPVRVFRIDRMRAAEPQEGPPFEVPAGFDVRAWAGRPPWELGEGGEERVRVRFAFPESRWVRSRRLGERIAEDDATQGATFGFVVRDRASFLRWILTFGRRARVETPPDVAEAVEGLRQEVAARYRGPGTQR